MRVRPGNRRAVIGQPSPHHVHLVILRHLDAQSELPHLRIGGVLVEQIDHLYRLRVVSDHALHELDVGRGGSHLRKVGGLRGVDGLRILARCAGLKDARARGGAAAGLATCDRGEKKDGDR